MAAGIQIVFDATDPARLAEFWIEALGYVLQPVPEGFESWDDWARAMGIPEERWNDARAIVDPEGQSPRVFIQRVPEGKTAKNRMHLDLDASGGPARPIEDRRRAVDAEVERLAGLGAAIVGPVSQRDEYWVVLQDPEGNEFCVH
ncbi:MAG: VOC family protein [Acidimicrobiia bacterium]|nr:VOC family protein [Acidimicrobiia bacterium]MBT8217255.1 VOC family protein [Acidimicrobiia bacterium]NNF08678.1 VOC family protein [Acidimicrobiia bacterium]NNL70622.1 VOC family protein [Acidimicrobiia bacterium]